MPNDQFESILGIDEAGRGCVLGDILLAGVTANKNQRKELTKIGCMDSKKFGSGLTAFKARKVLSQQINQICEVFYEAENAETIDQYVKNNQLNLLERQMAQRIIKKAKFDKALIDGKNIFLPLAKQNSKILAIAKADQKYVTVAAASIIAKHQRDQKILEFFDNLGANFNEFKFKGWGYINHQTFEFVKKFYLIKGKLPDNLRKSYQWQNLHKWLANKV